MKSQSEVCPPLQAMHWPMYCSECKFMFYFAGPDEVFSPVRFRCLLTKRQTKRSVHKCLATTVLKWSDWERLPAGSGASTVEDETSGLHRCSVDFIGFLWFTKHPVNLSVKAHIVLFLFRNTVNLLITSLKKLQLHLSSVIWLKFIINCCFL